MEVLTYGNKEKPCIIFLHGWQGGFASFSYFAKILSADYYCIVVDFNSTLKQNKVLTLDNFCSELEQFVKGTKLNNITLIGHSFGGRVSALFYNKNSEKVKKIILIDSAGLRPRRSLWYYIKVKWFKFNVSLAKLGIISKDRLKEFGSTDYKKLSDIEKQTFKNIVNRDLSKEFAKIDVPTLIYWGTKDKETPLYMAKKLNKLIKNSAIVKINGAGHFSYVEAPGQFINVVKAFMRSN